MRMMLNEAKQNTCRFAQTDTLDVSAEGDSKPKQSKADQTRQKDRAPDKQTDARRKLNQFSLDLTPKIISPGRRENLQWALCVWRAQISL